MGKNIALALQESAAPVPGLAIPVVLTGSRYYSSMQPSSYSRLKATSHQLQVGAGESHKVDFVECGEPTVGPCRCLLASTRSSRIRMRPRRSTRLRFLDLAKLRLDSLDSVDPRL